MLMMTTRNYLNGPCEWDGEWILVNGVRSRECHTLLEFDRYVVAQQVMESLQDLDDDLLNEVEMCIKTLRSEECLAR